MSVPNKWLINLANISLTIHYKIEKFVYKKMYDRLDYLYEAGLFDEAHKLINSIETNAFTLRMDMDLRLKQLDFDE